jgi:hypothetical protein
MRADAWLTTRQCQRKAVEHFLPLLFQSKIKSYCKKHLKRPTKLEIKWGCLGKSSTQICVAVWVSPYDISHWQVQEMSFHFKQWLIMKYFQAWHPVALQISGGKNCTVDHKNRPLLSDLKYSWSYVLVLTYKRATNRQWIQKEIYCVTSCVVLVISTSKSQLVYHSV